MKSSTKALLVALACVGVAGTATSQSLTDAAAKEKERRAKAKPAKTYTENELRSAGQGFSPEATADAPAEGAPAADGTKPAAGAAAATPEDEAAKRRKEWSDRFQKAEAEHRNWTEEAARIQAQLNSNTVDPYGAGRQQAVKALEEAQAKVTELQQKLSDLEDEGRRNRYKR
jgi:hypothetical protein